MTSWSDGWVNPMPIYQGIKPEVSSGFRTASRPGHDGADMMYRLARSTAPAKPRTDGRWFVPTGIIPAYSVGPGHVSKISRSSETGKQMVVIDHHSVPGFGALATAYIHLDQTLVVAVGQPVQAGSVIGIVGSTGTDLNHLHFEMWCTGLGPNLADWQVDPAPYLKAFGFITFDGPGSGGPLVAGGGGSAPGYPGKPSTSAAAMTAALALGAVAVAL